jgi:hypothetical protein
VSCSVGEGRGCRVVRFFVPICAPVAALVLVPTVNPKQLSITCESVDNRGDERLLKLRGYAVAWLFRSRTALQTEVRVYGINSMC